MNIVLAAVPVFMPTIMPYSLAMLYGALTARLDETVIALDLNALYHYQQFEPFYQRKESDFFIELEHFINATRHFYTGISQSVVSGRKPVGYEKILNSILKHQPDVVGLSLSYNSQIFFAKQLIADLKARGIIVVLGGPADYSKIMQDAVVLADADTFVEFLIKKGAKQKEIVGETLPDFMALDETLYFTKEIIFPLRTSISCPYKLCTFCTHHGNKPYQMFDLQTVRKAIIRNKMKKICFIDDDIPIPRLLELAAMLKPLNVTWWCQLRPLSSLIPRLPLLYDAGLCCVAWGVESGCQRILDLMQKGTKVNDIAEVLEAAHAAGIRNMAYIMFGFPTETEAEFNETISFLEKNKKVIDLVSPSVFGLQAGSRMFDDPAAYGIDNVKFEARTILGDKIHYRLTKGLTNTEAKALKMKNLHRIQKVNSLPKVLAACKEQVLNL